ncbi:hypothetical protein NEOC84_002053|nr:hypothetical protein [Neochlamydia sp. AcF95]NGY96117.1 hypothetical protein [Neochlamydia sp. AcF84]
MNLPAYQETLTSKVFFIKDSLSAYCISLFLNLKAKNLSLKFSCTFCFIHVCFALKNS